VSIPYFQGKFCVRTHVCVCVGGYGIVMCKLQLLCSRSFGAPSLKKWGSWH